jgi:2-polyprenyl-3-methyl-5-hydroxy-6-metoxy-1,4-benzoquinol methylase
MEQVLEHLPDPLKTLKQLKNSLNEKGLLFISIPNINSMQAKLFKEKWFHLDAPRHINHFYGKSFLNLIEKLNIKIKKRYYFNFHIDLTGWYWSLRNNKTSNLDNFKDLAILGIFFPLLVITTITKSTAYLLYVLTK